jgi:hypothetical protein
MNEMPKNLSPVQRILAKQDDNTLRLDPDLQRILDAGKTGDPAQIDAAMRESADAYRASPQGQVFMLESQALAQEMLAQQQQQKDQQLAMQQSDSGMSMSR